MYILRSKVHLVLDVILNHAKGTWVIMSNSALITIKAEKNGSYQWKKKHVLLEQFNTTMFGSAESFEFKLKQHVIFALYTISDILFHCNILTLNYYTSIFLLLYLVLIAKALHITFSTHRLLLIWRVFGWTEFRLVRLIFLAGVMFFSHNIPAWTVFSAWTVTAIMSLLL